ncbi:hypothetical protein [Ensifer sp. 4252]|uniref:hypothetical protein n=1 Tax=Ensifer sp. 4252 TaxID=3373915 RepID=UPI003D2137BF
MTGIDVSRILFSGLALGLRKTWLEQRLAVNDHLFVRRHLCLGSGNAILKRICDLYRPVVAAVGRVWEIAIPLSVSPLARQFMSANSFPAASCPSIQRLGWRQLL